MHEKKLYNPIHILCPIDFSQSSEIALKYAIIAARVFSAQLTILHVMQFEFPPYFRQEQMLDLLQQQRLLGDAAKNYLIEYVSKAVGPAAGSVALEYKVIEGPPALRILEYAEKGPYQLIIIGTHGRSAIQRFLLGSVTETILRNAEVPVFVVREKQHAFIDTSRLDAFPHIERILCPINSAQITEYVLPYLEGIAKRFNAQITIMYVVESDSKLDPQEARQQLYKWLSDRFDKDIQLVTTVGNPGKEIVAYASKTNQDLIILAAPVKLSETFRIFGKTTDFVIRLAPVPVLFIP